MTPHLLAFARAHAEICHPFESAGVVIEIDGQAEYRPCKNLGPTDQIDMDPLDMARAEDEGRLLGYVHSHPGGGAVASEADLHGCDVSGLPWWIVAGQDWTRIDPATRKQEGREFVMGVDDCWSLVREHFGIVADFARSDKFWETGATPHLDHMTAAGFVEIQREEMQPGDVLLFAVASPVTNHCAVNLGGGTMLHHLPGRLSRIDFIDGKWQSRITHIVRRVC